MNKKNLPKCLDCKKILKDFRSIRCPKCNYIFKTKHPRKYCIYCGKKLSRNAQFSCLKHFRKYNKGENASNFKHGENLYQHYCIDCKRKINSEAIRCRSCATKYQFKTIGLPCGKQIKYKNIWMRSGWEVKYAKWLDKRRIKWQYEPKAFDLGKTTYTPDFYLPESNIYIEIKGWWRDDAKSKFELFKKLYSKIKIKLYNQKKLKLLKII